MIEKNVYVELQKLSLALFLATKSSVERLFIGDNNHCVSHPFDSCAMQDREADSSIDMHARYLYERWRLLKEHTPTSNSQLILDAWHSYCHDCLTEHHTLPLLDLVHGWLLLNACQPHSDTCCFTEETAAVAISRLVLAAPTELSPTIPVPVIAGRCGCQRVICQAQPVVPDE